MKNTPSTEPQVMMADIFEAYFPFLLPLPPVTTETVPPVSLETTSAPLESIRKR
jgi:hypothetical protein